MIRLEALGKTKPETLVAIRIRAMRPSLEAVGRFCEDRVRSRLLDNFDSGACRLIFRGPDLAGFLVFREEADCFCLDHLYLDPPCQGQGLGSQVMALLQAQARSAGKPIRLQALKQSLANRFYLAQGFHPAGSSEWDNQYRWEPD